MAIGSRDLRIRVFHGAARLQLKQEQLPKTEAEYAAVLQAVKPHFEQVFLDLQGR